MFTGVTRRSVLAGVGALGIAVASSPRGVIGQGSTPAATPSVDLALQFPSGVLPTIYGDQPIPASVEKVVTITDGALDTLVALGLTPIATTRSANGSTVAEYLADKVPADIELLGGWAEDVDLEKIIGLAPEVILADFYLEQGDFDTLSKIAPTFCPASIEVADENALQQWEYEALALAHVLGRYDDALAAVYAARERAAGIKANISEHLGETVVVFRPQPDFPVVMSHKFITGRTLTWSGLAGSEFTESLDPPHSRNTVSLEQLQMLEADWLFAAARNQEQVDTLAVYEANPLFQDLTASQLGQVAMVDGALWSGTSGVVATHAMMDDIERIILRGEYE